MYPLYSNLNFVRKRSTQQEVTQQDIFNKKFKQKFIRKAYVNNLKKNISCEKRWKWSGDLETIETSTQLIYFKKMKKRTIEEEDRNQAVRWLSRGKPASIYS